MAGNRIKIKLNSSGSVTLKMERRANYGRMVTERIQFTMSRRDFERALKSATIEAPWVELMKR